MENKTVENMARSLLLGQVPSIRTGCGQCKFWDPDDVVIPDELKETHRICMKAKYYDEANSTTHMITNDISMVNAVLYTRFDFSCQHMTEG